MHPASGVREFGRTSALYRRDRVERCQPVIVKHHVVAALPLDDVTYVESLSHDQSVDPVAEK
jgi:hypothetical protein